MKTTPDSEELEELPRRSRTSAKQERVANERALTALADRLVSANPKSLAILELETRLLDAVADGRVIQSAAARARHLRHVRSMLRALDWMALLRKMDDISGGRGSTNEDDSDSARWATELSVQGDSGLVRFIVQYPDADRRRLRQLVMNVVRSPEAKRAKARHQLQMLVHAMILEHGPSPPL